MTELEPDGRHGGTGFGSTADHVVTFGRVLRRAGVPVGTDQIADALRAVDLVGVRRRDDFYYALSSVFVRHRDDQELFERAFYLFWESAAGLPDISAELSAGPSGRRSRSEVAAASRSEGTHRDTGGDMVASAAYSSIERLRKKDFAKFTADELEEAKAFIRDLHWPFEPRPVRRVSRFEKGRRFDFRHTVRRGLKDHGELFKLRFGGRKRREPPVVLLCDVSGSMELYARMLLRFMHAVARHRQRVESFVFGTRLTRITRHLDRRDIDEAVSAVAAAVQDWSGGTRIGESLKAFNYDWLRRVLRSDGIVVIISDGCDRGDPDLLGRELDRLARSCRSVLWLNPLLRYADYRPLTRGMLAALPHIERLMPVHNLESLEQLGALLSGRHVDPVMHRPGRSRLYLT